VATAGSATITAMRLERTGRIKGPTVVGALRPSAAPRAGEALSAQFGPGAA